MDPISFYGNDINLYRYVSNRTMESNDFLGLIRSTLSFAFAGYMGVGTEIGGSIVTDIGDCCSQGKLYKSGKYNVVIETHIEFGLCIGGKFKNISLLWKAQQFGLKDSFSFENTVCGDLSSIRAKITRSFYIDMGFTTNAGFIVGIGFIASVVGSFNFSATIDSHYINFEARFQGDVLVASKVGVGFGTKGLDSKHPGSLELAGYHIIKNEHTSGADLTKMSPIKWR